MEPTGNPELGSLPGRFAERENGVAHDLQRRIMACLNRRFPGLRDVHVTVIGHTAEVRGKVSSPSDRRLCLEYCRHVPGVIRIVDELTVAEMA